MSSVYGFPPPAGMRFPVSARDLFANTKFGMAVALAALAATGAATASFLPRSQSAAPPNVTFLTPVSTTVLQNSRAPRLTAPAP
ncbi:MAG: hypothetical protein H0W90_14825 [Actinobacteria bacterium]|nr:hypothetical protein [Actinomycetota bacterium]